MYIRNAIPEQVDGQISLLMDSMYVDLEINHIVKNDSTLFSIKSENGKRAWRGR